MMKKSTVLMLVFLASAGAFAEVVSKSAAGASRADLAKRRAAAMAARAQRSGGMITQPGSQQGKIVFVNCQKAVAESEISPVLETLTGYLRVDMKLLSGNCATEKCPMGDFDGELKKAGADAAVFIVENTGCSIPALVAPENRWAVVNVSALAADKPNATFLAARTRKEIMRTFLTLCGGTDSQFNGSLISPVKNVQALDKFENANPPMDVVGRVRKYLPKIGVTPAYITTYRTACMQGWAPSPTNDAQKAIWERVKADKERGPTNPIKIEYKKTSAK